MYIGLNLSDLVGTLSLTFDRTLFYFLYATLISCSAVFQYDAITKKDVDLLSIIITSTSDLSLFFAVIVFAFFPRSYILRFRYPYMCVYECAMRDQTLCVAHTSRSNRPSCNVLRPCKSPSAQ
jgi:hypothetical protein